MIDYILAILLIGVMPARAQYKSLRDTQEVVNRRKIYIRTGSIIFSFLIVLCYAWLHNNRPFTALGLDIPLSHGGLIGLGIAGSLFVVLITWEIFTRYKSEGRSHETDKDTLANKLLPRTSSELILFFVLSLLIGCGWELLYRGFLIWFLVPYAGTAGAICIAAIAYGAAHGYKNLELFLGSIASAFAFTIAFVLTDSLWWLMLIHTSAAMIGGLESYKMAAKHDTAQKSLAG